MVSTGMLTLMIFVQVSHLGLTQMMVYKQSSQPVLSTGTSPAPRNVSAQTSFCSFWFLKAGSHCIAPPGLELEM